MGNFKIGNVMPVAIGKIKAGSSNVQRIYNGSEQVWPPAVYYYLLNSCYGNQVDSCVIKTNVILYAVGTTPTFDLTGSGLCFGLYGNNVSTETAYNNNAGTINSVDITGFTNYTNCTTCNAGSGGSNLRISDCQTGVDWTAVNTYGHSLNDVVQYQVGTPGSGAVYCGTVTAIDSSVSPDASTQNAQTYACGDSVHCQT